ncbi:hypothetical protein CNR22_08080 [Sphingobacteriaceae bacterium]|nr:hypothetical protein CNR22_08080 [Sphingobacteriaceae bacterium]
MVYWIFTKFILPKDPIDKSHALMKLIKVTILVLMCLKVQVLFSQNSTCSNAAPFCTGQTMSYPAGVNTGSAQSGPDYGCLGSEPNPAWFFMQMASAGSMSINMSAANDIDFICWGPFPTLAGACGSLTSGNIQSCSYSGSNTETCTISNALPGEFYIMLITNFSNTNQTITFNQSNSGSGAASTNCGFVCVVSPTVSAPICAGQSVTLGIGPGTSTAVNSYTWSGPSFSSTSANNSVSNLTVSTMFTVSATSSAVVNGSPYTQTCQAVVLASVVPLPNFSISPTATSVCQGTSFSVALSFTPSSAASSNYYAWNSISGGVSNATANAITLTPPLAPASVSLSTLVYSVTATPISTMATCPVTKVMTVTLNNPQKPFIVQPNPVCDIFSAFQLSATPGGGTWTGVPAVSLTGYFTPSLSAIPGSTVVYKVNVANCIVTNSIVVPVSKFYSAALSSTLNLVCVQDPLIKLMNIVQNTLTGTWSGTQVDTNYFNPLSLATGTYYLTYSTTSSPNPSVCPDFTVLAVPLFNPPSPTISVIQPTCTNAQTVMLTANPAGGVWSGATGVSPSGLQTPSLNVPGTNTVSYAAGIGTCMASSSSTFHVSRFNTASFNGGVPPLCVSNNPVNLMGYATSTTGIWSGLGVITSSLFSPANLSTDIYTVTYDNASSPNPTLCPDSRSMTISVLNPPTPVISQVGPFCSVDAPVQLSVTPATGQWVPTIFLSPGGVFSPTASSAGLNAAQYVIGTNTCYAQQTLLISTEPFVSSKIIASVPDLCTTTPQMILSPITQNNLGSWSGAGIVGGAFDPALSGAGNFIISYNTSSYPSGLCPDHSTLSVNVFSLATPKIASAGPFCNKSQPSQLEVSPVGGIFSAAISNIVSLSGVFNPAFAKIGDNIVSYSIASGPCIADAQLHISVEEFISADFLNRGETSYCSTSFPFNLNGLVQNPGGSWLGDAPVEGTMFNPAKAYEGINTVTYQTHSNPSYFLCPDTKTLNILVKNVPVIKASGSLYKGCAPFSVTFNSTAKEAGIYSWNFGDGTGTEKFEPDHLFETPGTYTVVFNYSDRDALGCSTQVVLNEIKVLESPIADFIISPEEITIANPDVLFNNTSTNLYSNRYKWTIEGLNQSYDVNPLVYFPQAGKYKVTLNATNIYDCKSEISKIVDVKNIFEVYIPNSFTPNYDGLNDFFKPVFSPYGLDAKNYSLQIFDRWGKQIFTTGDYLIGWDGTLNNKGDDPLKNDTYIFRLNYKDLNGQVYNKIGEVTLLK